MANYKLTFHLVDGSCVGTSAAQKPEDITDFTKELTGTAFQVFLDSSTKACMVNMNNVSSVEVEKI